jgi:hypothetical protein
LAGMCEMYCNGDSSLVDDAVSATVVAGGMLTIWRAVCAAR